MQSPQRQLFVRIATQQIELREGGAVLGRWPVSTSGYGLGSEEGSLRTPLGRFRIWRKIGDGAAVGAVFRGRELTGEFGSEEDAEDLVQTRILWLDGLEPENANTRERYIYIHGTNHEAAIGTACSHGCVRMRNEDVVGVFDLVGEEDVVVISDDLPMNPTTLIERKRDGLEFTRDEIAQIIGDYTRGAMPDYQMAALAMAIYFRGMTPAETAHLTRAMMESGRVLSYPHDAPPRVDKHSTGGIGDKVSLILAPLLACAGDVWVPMISGRGLGITGGTLDKLESIPGFRTRLAEAEALAQLARIGVFMIGQTDDICPADRALYALRDVTATVPAPPLIISSIMSKKLAENLDRLVLDVKFGSGAFMKTRAEAVALAEGLTAVGEQMGVKMAHRLTPMDEPLGRTVGNALEVMEAVETLQGRGPTDLVELTLDLAARVSGGADLRGRIADGSAWESFVALVEAQGGDATALERLGDIHRAPVEHELPALKSGQVARMDAGLIGRACLLLGAGRKTTDDAVDAAVGCSAVMKVGEQVERGQPLLRIHARDEASLRAALPMFEEACRVR